MSRAGDGGGGDDDGAIHRSLLDSWKIIALIELDKNAFESFTGWHG